jgi:hypothetical protein
MFWALLWVVLVLAAAAVLALLGLSLWRKAKALTAEVSVATRRLEQVSATLSELADQAAQREDRPSSNG